MTNDGPITVFLVFLFHPFIFLFTSSFLLMSEPVRGDLTRRSLSRLYTAFEIVCHRRILCQQWRCRALRCTAQLACTGAAELRKKNSSLNSILFLSFYLPLKQRAEHSQSKRRQLKKNPS